MSERPAPAPDVFMNRVVQAARDAVIEAARYWASALDTGSMPDGSSIETSCEILAEAVDMLNRVEGRKQP